MTTAGRIFALLQLPLLAVGSGGLLWFLLIRLPTAMGEMPYVGVWLQLVLMLYVGVLIWLFVCPLAARVRTNAILLSLGLFFLAILTLKLQNSPFTVGGINGDARFYTTYITKLAAYPGYGDMFYKGLPSFYPPLYYFIVGRIADWLTIEPFRVMKYALLVTVMVLPLLTGALWRRLVDERFVAAVALCMLVYPDWFKPNEWLALACFVPWWLHWVDNITGYRPATTRAQLWWWLGGGLIGALIFQLYFFWLFVGGVTLLVRIGWWLLWRRRDRTLRGSLVNAILMLTVTALLSSPFWAPYLYSMFTTGGWQPLQNRWFSDSKVPLPLYFLENQWQAVVYLGGLAYLVLAAHGDRVARGLLWLVGGFFVWVAIGYVGILVNMPLLTFRSYPVLTYLLGAGAFLGLFRFWHGDFELRDLVGVLLPWQRVATSVLIFVLLLFANGVIVELQSQENVQDAGDATYPAEELATFDRLTHGDYSERVGLVTDRYRSILFFRPLYSFLAWSAHFSHPAGQFHARADFLTKAARLQDPALFAIVTAVNRFDTIDYFLLRLEHDQWHYQFVDDNFPNRVIDRAIDFPPYLLAEPYFAPRVEADYTLFARAMPPTLRALLPTVTTFDVVNLAPADVARFYILATNFAEETGIFYSQTAQAAAYKRLVGGEVALLPVELLLDLRGAATGELATLVESELARALGLPAPVVLVDEGGTARVALLGYRVQANPTDAANATDAGAEEVTMTLYFEALAPMAESYHVWLHVFGPTGEKVNFDHLPALPTTAWSPGQLYRDTTTLTVPAGRYQIDVGLWEPDLDQRLLLDGEPGVTLGQVELSAD